MKVKLTENYKEFYTLADLERAKTVINCEKDDDATAREWAEYAVREALKNTNDGLVRVIEASAEACKNNRIAWDGFCTDSGNMDVYISAIAETYDGFIKIGAYLSDIWHTGYDYSYKDNMFIRYYTEKK